LSADPLQLGLDQPEVIRGKYPQIARPLEGPNVSAANEILDPMNRFVGLSGDFADSQK
jgi:hypothetical protein